VQGFGIKELREMPPDRQRHHTGSRAGGRRVFRRISPEVVTVKTARSRVRPKLFNNAYRYIEFAATISSTWIAKFSAGQPITRRS